MRRTHPSGLVSPIPSFLHFRYSFSAYFFAYPTGQTGLAPETFLMVLPFTQEIVLIATLGTEVAIGADAAGTGAEFAGADAGAAC